jgi:multiple sugar transport system ATP-binding protein
MLRRAGAGAVRHVAAVYAEFGPVVNTTLFTTGRGWYCRSPVAGIAIEAVTKSFPNGYVAVRDLSLKIEDGEFMVLVGPSGCGKTTLLRLIAGLEQVTAGQIEIGGEDVTDRPPRRRDVAMVFQSYALYPHMNVRQNLAYGLKVRRTPKAEARRRVEEVAGLLGLSELLDRKPAQLSGGQRQRVAMGRAIVREPRAFLMDEPLSNLDAKLRVGMRASLSELHARLGVTTVYVTHDQVEAMTLGQRVAVMRDGRILQVDRPQRLYEEPQDLFVAAFIGSPAMNLVEARIDGNEVVFGQFRAPLDPHRRPASGISEVVLGIRPEAFEDAAFSANPLPTVEITVAVLEELGADSFAHFRVDAPRITAESLEADDDATLLAEPSALFSGRLDPKTRATVGEQLTLAVDPSEFHFFDAKSGATLLGAPEPAEAMDLTTVLASRE